MDSLTFKNISSGSLIVGLSLFTGIFSVYSLEICIDRDYR